LKTPVRANPEEILPSRSDLDLAWVRAKLDRPERCFVTYPFLLMWIETDLKRWLDRLQTRIDGGYSPSACQICYEPKPKWMVRPGAVMELKDEIVFNAILGHFHAEIWNAIDWSQGDPDVANQFQKNAVGPSWVHSDFRVWNEWREKSLHKLNEDVQFVVFADIAAFYENIDLQRLRSDLLAAGLSNASVDLLTSLLSRWAHPRGKGIPQGYSASDILAKIYMSPVDHALQNAGFRHLRYVDDIRIFCRDSLEARRALLQLNELLRNRGLNLQTAKTEIIRIDEARRRIDGVAPVIDTLNQQLKNELRSLYASAGGYGRLSDIDKVVATHPDAPPPEVLERAFRDNFAAPADQEFDKTLLHYLLRRLGRMKSRIAIPFCLSLLRHRPEETEAALRYFSDVDLTEKQVQSVLDYAGSSYAIYDYQLYQILRWFWERNVFPDKLTELCRRWAFDRNRASWLRSYCIAILGKVGDESDLDAIESQYSAALTETQKAECVMALARLERGRRNAFYGRIKHDGELVACAIRYVKERDK
jgi:reverse transcriptase-like protein